MQLRDDVIATTTTLELDSVKHRRNTDATSSSTDLSTRWYDTALYMNSHAARDLSLTFALALRHGILSVGTTI